MNNRPRASMTTCLVTALIALVLAPGCRETHQIPDPGPGSDWEVPRPELPTSGDPSLAGVGGKILLIGLTPDPSSHAPSAVDGGFPGSPGGEPGAGIGLPNVQVKVVDPGHDILRSTLTDETGNYEIGLNSEVSGLLEVSVKVLEDIDGDGVGGDLLTQAVPLLIPAGSKATVEMVLSLNLDGSAGGGDAFPPSSPIVLVDFFQEDLNGSRRGLLAQGGGGTMMIDRDGDNYLEPGDDPIYSDNDKNGLPDNYEEAVYGAPDAPPMGLADSGTVTSVDIAGLTLELLADDGRELHILLSPFASIMRMDASGNLLGPIPLAADMIGEHVLVNGIDSPDGYIADFIVIGDKSIPGLPGDPGRGSGSPPSH